MYFTEYVLQDPVYQSFIAMPEDDYFKLFCSIGLSEQKARETIKNENFSKRLKMILTEASKYGSLTELGMLYYHLASKMRPNQEKHTQFLVSYIGEKKLNNTQRIDAALQYLLAELKDIDANAFDEYCGVGVVVSADEIEQTIEEVIEKYKKDILEKRYKFNSGIILQEVRNRLKWADGKIVKTEVDLQVIYRISLNVIDETGY